MDATRLHSRCESRRIGVVAAQSPPIIHNRIDGSDAGRLWLYHVKIGKYVNLVRAR